MRNKLIGFTLCTGFLYAATGTIHNGIRDNMEQTRCTSSKTAADRFFSPVQVIADLEEQCLEALCPSENTP